MAMNAIGLSRPPVLWSNGGIVPWDKAQIHVWTDLATRATNVFEGIRATRFDENVVGVVDLERHMRRLFRSAELLRLPTEQSTESMLCAITDLLDALPCCADYYIRPTLYLEDGRWATRLADATIGSYVVATPIEAYPAVPRSVRCTVSEFRKVPADAFSPLIKTGAIYQTYRLPMLDARERGFDEPILLGEGGRVTETTGSSIIAVFGDTLVTPRIDDGILDSITRRRLLTLAMGLGLAVEERTLWTTELLASDEVLLAGTLTGILAVSSIDTTEFSAQPGAVTTQLYQTYRNRANGLVVDDDMVTRLTTRRSP
jgi:branched-chain amino acid aminotransferase